MTYRVLLLGKYSRMGASSRLRTLQYLPYLEAEGFDITVQSLFDDRYLDNLYARGRRSPLAIAKLYFIRLIMLFNCYKYDLIWIEKELFPYLPAFTERLLHLLGKPYVVDYDDAVFHNYDLSRFWLIRKILGRKIDVVMRHANCVIVGNAYLEARAKLAGAPETRLIPTVVDLPRYTNTNPLSKEGLTIGWIGSPSTQQYILELQEPLARICKKFDARLLLVGATRHIAAKFPGTKVEIVPWSEETEAKLIGQMDIGVMPLPDEPWEKGKCGYKLIQYMACTVPIVASPIGVNRQIVNDTGGGFLASSSEQWEEALTRLLQSSDLRNNMGRAGKIVIDNRYALVVQQPKLKAALLYALGK